MTILWHRQRGDTAMIKPCYALEGGPSGPTGWMASTRVGRKPSSMSSMLIGRRQLMDQFRSDITAFALRHRLPAMYTASGDVEAGGLMTYRASLPDMYRRAASYVDKILKGTKPGDLPVEQPTKFTLVI